MRPIKRILLVDDDAKQLKLTKLFFEHLGITVSTAIDGEAALESLSREKPDGVVADILMPRLDGFRLCRAIRHNASLKDLPIVLLTASFTEPEDFKLAKDMGATALVTRTVSASESVDRSLHFLRFGVVDSSEINRNIVDEYNSRLTRQLALKAEEATGMQEKISRFTNALNETQTRLELIANAMRDVFFIARLQGAGVDYVSTAYERVWGRSCASLYADPTSWLDAVVPEDRSTAEQALQESHDQATTEFRIRTPKGDTRWIQVRTFHANDPVDGTLRLVGSAADVTESKLLAEELRQAQKMEAVGRFAGGVAHDFNNLLSAILAYGAFVREALPEQGQARDDLQEILHAAERAASLTRQLMSFSRRRAMNPQVVSIDPLLRDTEKLIRPLIGEDIRVILATETERDLLTVDPGSIEQLVINLAINARDAMPRGGELAITTIKVEDEDVSIGMPKGTYVALSVSDTGTGMTDEVRKHLFEPFFTTKEPGKGTGLGLATCYAIAKQNNAYIKVRTQLGAGSLFTVYFPVANLSATATVVEATAKDLSVPDGDHTILLVEDEEALRVSTARALREKGYQILEARNASECVGIFEKAKPESVHLLLTDLVMPGMNGCDLAATLRSKSPNLPVLFMSGYAEGTLSASTGSTAGIPLLQKPFSVGALIRSVQETLASLS